MGTLPKIESVLLEINQVLVAIPHIQQFNSAIRKLQS